ncbi:outer membrane protein assembly factor BamA [Candidatus Manganitrophus noduliformans]|uniref:Outer membrane protein assembly factor BamA n=1 Tax=Candidatus Manganitrophus noduliformans TaxID=2606439 RepID=A0A7X6I9H2_9BACT|nr:outer membrane protein assembly factor BamA [Candidatus Manganitrophus noduliformans]NKE69411.1 outer membrane protein assembly factor BamA [Candidatus Manganitrophus noduliformans]
MEVEPAGEEVTVKFVLIERRLLSSIDLSGNYFVSEEEILGAIGMKPGDEFTEARWEKALSDVSSLYRRKGYFQTRFSTDLKRPPGDRRGVDLSLKIREGDPAKIRNLRLTGQKVFSDTTIKLRMMTSWPKEYYRFDKLEENIRAVEAFYYSEGYLKAVVGPPILDFIERTNEVDITLPIAASNKIDLHFDGRGPMSVKQLEPLVLIKEEGSDDSSTLEQSAQEIEEFYRRAGYPFVQVTVSALPFPEENRTEVRFKIESGSRTRIRQIKFSGNHSFSSERLREIVRLQKEGRFSSSLYTREQLDEDASALVLFYKREGFRNPRVAPEIDYDDTRTDATVTYKIDEGIRTRIGRITLQGNQRLPETTLKEALRIAPEDPYYEAIVREGARQLLSAYEKEGYLYAAVQSLTDFSEDQTTADITYDLSEGEQVRVGRIVLDGNLKTRDHVLLRELVIREGDPYSFDQILTSQQRLYRTGLFSGVRFEPIRFEDKPTVHDLQLSVTERPSIGVEFGFGYADFEGVRGFFELSHRNLFGTGRSLSARAQGSRVQELYTLSYREPWFFFRDTDAHVVAAYEDREERTYDLERASGTVGVDKSFSKTVKGSLVYQYERNRLSNVDPDAQLTQEDIGRVTIGSITPSLIRDTRDDPFNPRSGSLNGITVQDAAQIFGSEAQFVKTTVQSSWYQALSEKLVFAFSARAGVAQRFGETEVIPLTERFLAGGRSTVRGYGQDKLGVERVTIINGDPIGGNAMLIFNEELRIALPRSFGLVLFFDHGNVWLDHRDVRFSDIKSTTGIGVRYNTPVGPFRLDWGYKLNREADEDPWTVHFTLGHAF